MLLLTVVDAVSLYRHTPMYSTILYQLNMPVLRVFILVLVCVCGVCVCMFVYVCMYVCVWGGGLLMWRGHELPVDGSHIASMRRTFNWHTRA